MEDPTLDAHFAGLFDGEGNINICRAHSKKFKQDYYALHVVVTNANPLPLMKLQSRFGGKIKPKKKYQDIHKQCYRWRACSTEARGFLEAVIPYLIIKLEEALLAIEFQDSMRHLGNRWHTTSPEETQRRAGFAVAIKDLKRRDYMYTC